jgi:hypothetical protein
MLQPANELKENTMNLRNILMAVASIALIGTAHAHDCSGGTGGGMDATGNECNDTIAAVPVAPVAAKAVVLDRPEVRAKQATAGGARGDQRPAKAATRLVRAGAATGR